MTAGEGTAAQKQRSNINSQSFSRFIEKTWKLETTAINKLTVKRKQGERKGAQNESLCLNLVITY